MQQYRVELPGPKVTKDIASDARVRVEMRRDVLQRDGEHEAQVADWREAFDDGQREGHRASSRSCS